MKSSANSLEIKSQDSGKDKIIQQINDLNNQYFLVRRPNETNVLEFLHDQDIKNQVEQVASSPFQEQVQDQHSVEQVLLDNFQNSEISNKMLSRLSQNQVYEQNIPPFEDKTELLFKKIHSSFFTKPIQMKLEYLQKIQDLVIFKEKDYSQIIYIHDCLYLISSLILLFEATISISFGTYLIYPIAIYCIIIGIYFIEIIKLFRIHFLQITYHLVTIMFIIIYIVTEIEYFGIGYLFIIQSTYQKYRKYQNILLQNYYFIIISISIIINYFLYVHICACLFYLFSQINDNNWICNLDLNDWQSKYLTTLNYVVTTTTTISQNQIVVFSNNLEIFLNILLIFISITYLSYTIFAFDWKNNEYLIYQSKQTLNQYFNRRNIDKELKDISQNYLGRKMQISEDEIARENQLLQQLPFHYQREIQYEMFEHQLKAIPFLSKLSQHCIDDIIGEMREILLPSQYLLEDTGLFFLLEGQVDAILPNHQKIGSLSCGHVMGQQITFLNKHQIQHYKTKTTVRLAYLSHHRFQDLIQKHPYDYQLYKMQLELGSLQLELGINCFICHGPHFMEVCPQTHLILDKFSIILDHLKSQPQERHRMERNSRRTTNAKYGQKLFEDAVSMFLEVHLSEKEIQIQPAIPQHKVIRKKSKSLTSEESRIPASNHSISAIAKPPGSALSSSTFNVFKDVHRKISKHQDSEKISSHSQKQSNQSQQLIHKSSSNSFRDFPQGMEDRLIDDSVMLAVQRRKKSSIGRISSLRMSPTNNVGQGLPSVSEIQTESEDHTLLHQYSAQSSRRLSPSIRAKNSSKGNEIQKEDLLILQELEMEDIFDKPMDLKIYCPQYNYTNVIDNYKKIQNENKSQRRNL